VAVHIEKRAPVTTIVLDRPEARNAIDRAHAEALADAVRAFEVDPAAHVAVLWGAGGHFCAGADLKAIAAGAPNRVAPTGDGPLGPTRLRTSKPVIAAIAGFAVAGGLELAIWCDLRIVEASATLGVFCRRWGVPLIDGGTVRLPRLIGQGRALDLILTGRPVGSDEALRIGLADRVVPDGTSRDAAEALAHEIAAHPQACLRGDRASAIDQWSLPEALALRQELDHGLRSLAEGAVEGARAFAATRRAHQDPDPDGR